MHVKSAFLAITLSAAICLPAFAASGGIRSNRLNECAIWLCLPGGFGEGCGDAYNAFVGRITDVTSKGKRKYTDLPDFPVCVDQDPEHTASNLGDPSEMTYESVYYAFIPTHRECRRWNSDGGGCISWVTVPEHRIKGAQCRFNGSGSSRYGTDSTPAYCSHTIYEITVYGDGIKYGNSYEYTSVYYR